MAYLSRNANHVPQPISEQSEVSIRPLGGHDGIEDDESDEKCAIFKNNIKKPALLERPLLFKVPSLKHMSRLAVNKFNLRNITNEPLSEYIHQYPYPI